MDLISRIARKISQSAKFIREYEGGTIYCEAVKGKNPPSIALYSLMNGGEVCVVTDFYSTGHSSLDSNIDTERMSL